MTFFISNLVALPHSSFPLFEVVSQLCLAVAAACLVVAQPVGDAVVAVRAWPNVYATSSVQALLMDSMPMEHPVITITI